MTQRITPSAIILVFLWVVELLPSIQGISSTCPGQYCGKIIGGNGEIGKCEACPRGFRSNGTYCFECSSSPSLYDWLYLGFMALMSLVLHWFFIDIFAQREIKSVLALFLSAFVESTLAALFTLLSNKPTGKLNLTSCKAEGLADWYTIFFNPKPDFVNTIHCTQEAVYPLYTLVLCYYALSVGLLLLFRPLVSHQFCRGQGRKSIYAALYFLPVLAAVHALFSGLIYYAYPYITLVVSVLSTAAVLAKNNITNFRQLIRSRRHVIIIIAHWLIHAYGILAVTLLRNPSVDGAMFSLVLTPVLFFLGTNTFTEPDKFKS